MDHVAVYRPGDADEDVVLLIVHAHKIVKLFFKGSFEVLIALKVPHLAGLGSNAFAGLPHDTVVHGDVQHLGHDEHAQGVDAGLAGQIQVQTARQGIVPRLLQRHPLVHQALDIALVRDKGRHTQAGLDQLQGFLHQLFRRFVMNPQRNGELGSPHLVGRAQDQIAQLIGGVVAVLVHAADDEVVPPGHAGPLVPLFGVAGDKVELHDFDAQALDELYHIVVGERTAGDILLVEGIHILVKTSW